MKSVTFDEGGHFHYGRKVLQGNPERERPLEDSKMPFSVLNVLTFKIGNTVLGHQLGGIGGLDQAELNIFFMRVGTIICALILLIITYLFSWELYGPMAGLLSLCIAAFSPNLIALGRLVTTDTFASLMITASIYTFWRFLKFGGLTRGMISATVLGLAQLAKYTSVYLYPLFLVMAFLRFMPEWVSPDAQIKLYSRMKVLLSYAVIFLVVSLLIINFGFVFQKTFTPLKSYAFDSHLFTQLQDIPVLRDIPLPLPYPFIKGLDMVKHHEMTGKTFGNLYLLGEVRRTNGNFEAFPNYFFIAFLFKVPIAVQIIIIMAFFYYLLNLKSFRFRQDELILFVPVFFFTIYFNYFFNVQIGIRYLLIIFPLVFVFCGSLLSTKKRNGMPYRGLLAVLLIFQAVSVVSYHPHYLSYFNEFIGDRKNAYKYLADSNIDWGQNEWYLKEYRKKYPDAVFEPDTPTNGRVIVSVNQLVGIINPNAYKWLRTRYEPVDHIGYSYLVYDIPEVRK